MASVIGSALADAISGYVIYIPASIVIKALMAFVAYKGYRLAEGFSKTKKHIGLFITSIVAEAVMVCGYFLYEVMLYGVGGATASLVGNILQGTVAVVVCNILFFKFMERSVARISLYSQLDTIKIDTTEKSILQVCNELMKI